MLVAAFTELLLLDEKSIIIKLVKLFDLKLSLGHSLDGVRMSLERFVRDVVDRSSVL